MTNKLTAPIVRGLAVIDGGGYQDDKTAEWSFSDEGLQALARAIEKLLSGEFSDEAESTYGGEYFRDLSSFDKEKVGQGILVPDEIETGLRS